MGVRTGLFALLLEALLSAPWESAADRNSYKHGWIAFVLFFFGVAGYVMCWRRLTELLQIKHVALVLLAMLAPLAVGLAAAWSTTGSARRFVLIACAAAAAGLGLWMIASDGAYVAQSSGYAFAMFLLSYLSLPFFWSDDEAEAE